jgi:Flp pilus assembly protein TadD
MRQTFPRDVTHRGSRHAISEGIRSPGAPRLRNRIAQILPALAFIVSLTFIGVPIRAQQEPMATDHHNDRPLALEDAASAAPSGETELQLRLALKQEPQSADLLYKLALVLRLEGKAKESLQIYTQAAALRHPTASELRSVAFDYVTLNDYDDAIRWRRVALTLAPRDVDVLYSLGRCLYTQNQFHEAEVAFTKALEVDPSHLKSEENLGLTLSAENRPEQAEAALRTAAQWAEQRHVSAPWPYADLGSFLLDQQQPAGALPFLRKALQLDPASALNHQNLGRALLAAGSSAAGIAELEAAAKITPDDPKIHFQLGHAYRDAGQPEKARAEFDLSKRLYGRHNRD